MNRTFSTYTPDYFTSTQSEVEENFYEKYLEKLPIHQELKDKKDELNKIIKYVFAKDFCTNTASILNKRLQDNYLKFGKVNVTLTQLFI